MDNKHPFDGLNQQEQIDALIDYTDNVRDLVFDLQQKVDFFEKEMDLRLTPDEILQRKDVWTKKEVCSYFDIDAKSFERYKKAGELKVKSIGGKDYCRLIDLKDRFRDRGEAPR